MRLLQHAQPGHAAALVLLRAVTSTCPSSVCQPVTCFPTAFSALTISLVGKSIHPTPEVNMEGDDANGLGRPVKWPRPITGAV